MKGMILMSWYQFNQNDSFGYFDVNDKLCHRLFIEANSEREAADKAVELGCYFDGVHKGIDCSCCGDRWSGSPQLIDLDDVNERGWRVCCYMRRADSFADVKNRWQNKYGMYEIKELPQWRETSVAAEYGGKIKFRNIEEFAQFLANEYGWTSPDVRLYYVDGRVKEIYSQDS
nr:MAG TPA: hypothetical protein [Caudoviricetes sp.]